MGYSAAVDAPHSTKCTVCSHPIMEGDLVVIGPRELIHVRCWLPVDAIMCEIR